MFVEEAF
jgi:hypothetical protein